MIKTILGDKRLAALFLILTLIAGYAVVNGALAVRTFWINGNKAIIWVAQKQQQELAAAQRTQQQRQAAKPATTPDPASVAPVEPPK